MKKIIITVFICAIAMNSAFTQFDITGVIRDSKTKEPLPNAGIYIQELSKGTVADGEGKFILKNIPSGNHKIKFSYLGYSDEVKEVQGNSGLVSLDISLNPESSFCLNQVVITGGTYSTQDETAIKIETLNKKDIEGFGGVSLIKDLSRIPGIDAVSKGNGIATPIIRGLSTNNILVLNNGVKMQNFQFSVNHPYLIDEFGVEKIEVVKGPASLLFGSNAVGGALNFIKESPATKGAIKTDINMNYNTNTQGIITNVGVKATPGNFFYGVRAGLKSHRDYTDGEGRFVPNSRFNNQSFKAFTGYNTKKFTSKIFFDYNKMKLGLTVPPAIKLFKENSRKNEFWYQDLSNILISSKNVFYAGNFRNELNVNYQTNNRKLFENPDGKEVFNTVDMLLNTLTYEAKTTKTFGRNKFVFAIQGLSQSNKNSDVPEHVLPDFKLDDIAGVGILQLNYKKKIHAQFGVRYDIRKINIYKQETVKTPIKKNFQNISFSMGLTADISKHILLRSNVASGFRTPSIAELSQDGGHGARFEVGDPTLEPQRNIEGDLSMHYHSRKSIFEISGFYNKINNYIYLTPTDKTSLHGLPVYEYTQDIANLYGIETNFGYFPLKWLKFNLAYNFLVAKKQDNSYLPLIPQNKLRSSISVTMPLNKKYLKDLSFEIEGIHAFEKNKYHWAETSTPAYSVFNLSFVQSMIFNRNTVKINAKINNVLNTTYIDHISTLKGLGYYEIGRNVNIGVKILLN